MIHYRQHTWAAWDAAVAGAIFGSCISHLQISPCSLSVAIYGTYAHAAAWLRMKQGLGELRGEEEEEEGRDESGCLQ